MTEPVIKIESNEIKTEVLSESENGDPITENPAQHLSPSGNTLCTKKCPLCSKTFTSTGDLKRHSRVHTGEKPFSCPYCPKRFAQLYNLKVHRRMHTGERPYPCSHCPKNFRNSSDLKRHIRVHTKEKPYCCPICKCCFSQSSTLKLHSRTHGPKVGTGFLFVDCGTTEDLD